MVEPNPEAGWIERRICWLEDQRWGWIGFEWLRPRPHEFHTIRTLIRLTMIVLLPVSVMGAGVIFLLTKYWLPGPHELAVTFTLFSFAACFTGGFSYQYISGHYWNRRAFRLRQQPGFEIQDPRSQSPIESPPDSDSNPYSSPRSFGTSLEALKLPPLPMNQLW